ncbi:unnamed protein product [Cylindrotheca closterium]|uniref:HSF-type DNA-binding domain-containing protein n=1 Tax=Cylindrotheca closterium TaxID=2856 RepID=A0AAD2FV56_9STRA|nr:unnamed protein product [Cylindrotheca closterium]
MCIGLNRRIISNNASSGVAANAALLNVWNAKQQQSTDLQSLLRSNMPSNEPSRMRQNPTIKDQKHHITVQHNYHDHANDYESELKHVPARGGVITPFPLKLHAMLEAVQNEGLEHIVSWQPHGRCFVVRDPKAFVPILDKHFKVTKIASFQRQLNLYGFQRITKGRDRGGYYHELFLRGKVFLVQNIHRVKVKGTKIRARSNPEQEPNFYAMPFVGTNMPSMAPQMSSASVMNQQLSLQSLLGDSAFDPVPICNMRPAPWDLKATAAPVVPKKEESLEPLPWDDVDENFLASDADEFFKDFDFPADSTAFADIEDDNVFGDLLEQIVDI